MFIFVLDLFADEFRILNDHHLVAAVFRAGESYRSGFAVFGRHDFGFAPDVVVGIDLCTLAEDDFRFLRVAVYGGISGRRAGRFVVYDLLFVVIVVAFNIDRNYFVAVRADKVRALFDGRFAGCCRELIALVAKRLEVGVLFDFERLPIVDRNFRAVDARRVMEAALNLNVKGSLERLCGRDRRLLFGVDETCNFEHFALVYRICIGIDRLIGAAAVDLGGLRVGAVCHARITELGKFDFDGLLATRAFAGEHAFRFVRRLRIERPVGNGVTLALLRLDLRGVAAFALADINAHAALFARVRIFIGDESAFAPVVPERIADVFAFRLMSADRADFADILRLFAGGRRFRFFVFVARFVLNDASPTAVVADIEIGAVYNFALLHLMLFDN